MYAKLVFKNARKSVKDYLIYIVTMTISVALFYSFLSISSRYYHPDIGSAYELRILGDGMKMAVCAVTLLLLFLIRYVDSYMLRQRQKEFAVQAVMGMEQKTIGMLFFAETFVMGLIAIAIGIFIGAFGSQFITAMLLTSYGKSYRIAWMLFPDTVFFTITFFCISFIAVGMFHIHSIRKMKVIDMLLADRENEPSLKKSRQMPVVIILFELFTFWMLVTGVRKYYFYYDSRFELPVKIMFWGNILLPAITLLVPVIWRFFVRKIPGGRIDGGRYGRLGFPALVVALLICAAFNAICASGVPSIQNQYNIVLGTDAADEYIIFVLADLLFFICAVIYLASRILLAFKEMSLEHKYHGTNLFFWGQIITKLSTTNKTMTLISMTLVLAIFLFIAAPVLVGWASGFLDVRAKYDVQIFTWYNQIYEEEKLPRDDYAFVSDFLQEYDIEAAYDCTFNLYLPKRTDFHNRVKRDFPAVAISLSDYNEIRRMFGYETVSLKEDEFTTQWQTIATQEERNEYLEAHAAIETDAGELALSEQSYYTEAIGETVYNLYTDVLLVFPDEICKELLPVMRDRYIITKENISYTDAIVLQELFFSQYPEEGDSDVNLRMKTLQINDTKANNFVLQAVMIYGGVVLMVICLTILSLQQLLDAGHYQYRFGVLRKLGVEEKEMGSLVLKQLGVWFGLPVAVAALVAMVIVSYFISSVSVEVSAYIGFGTLMPQIFITAGILAVLLFCYFLSTWILFRRIIRL